MKNLTLLIVTSLLLLINTTFAQKWEWIYPNPTGCHLWDICFTDSTTAYIVGDNGTILKTENFGDSWEQLYSGTNEQLMALWFTDKNTGYVIGLGGAILKTTNAGYNWTYLNASSTNGLIDIYFTDSNTGYIACWDGIILKTTDAGKHWNSTYVNAIWMWSIFFVDKDLGYAVASESKIFKTYNAGANWEEINTNLDEYNINFNNIFFVNPSLGYATGDTVDQNGWSYGVILKSYNGGSSWEYISSPEGQYNSINFSDSNNGYILGDIYNNIDGQWYMLIKTSDGGNTWTYYAPEYWDDYAYTYFLNGSFYKNRAFGVGLYGLISKSEDYGNSWSVSSSEPRGSNYDICFVNKNTGYSAGYPNNLKTTDGGKSWSQIDNLPGGYKISFADTNVGYIMDRYTNIYKTIDAGTSWDTVANSLPHCVAICFTSPEIGYLGGFYGEIFKSTDGGSTWTVKTSDTNNQIIKFAFPEKNIGYAISLRNLLKTNDSGENWINIHTDIVQYTGVYFINKDIGYISGYIPASANWTDPANYKTIDGGLNWTKLNTKINCSEGYCFDKAGMIFFVDDSTGYIYDDNGCFKTESAGEHWENFPDRTLLQTYSAWFPKKNIGFFVGTGGKIVKLNTGDEFLKKFAPDGAEWYYSFSNNNKTGYTKIYPTGDTIIKDFKYRVLQKVCIYYDSNLQKLDTLDIGEEYMREELGNIMWYKNNSDHMLYDFQAVPGDSWKVPGTFPWLCDTIGTIILEGKETMNINGKDLLKITLSHPNFSKYHLGTQALEGIGSIDSYLLPEPTCNIGELNHGGPFRCYSDSVLGFYSTNIAPFCDYTIDIKTIDYNPEFKSYPNPAKDFVVFDYTLPKDKYHLKIYNFLGIVVKEIEITDGIGKVKWDINNVITGMYIYSINQKDVNISGKILITR